MITKADALLSLRPTARCEWVGEEYSGLEWIGNQADKPTEAEIDAEYARLQADYASKEYQRKRAAEYPPITDYIDGVVKGDQAQIDAYIAACQAVKTKYPKA
jgi:hypothetical protein